MKIINKESRDYRNGYIIKLLLPLLFILSCENVGVIDDENIDPHIIFSSIRLWNYDIFIADMYSENITHITKNKWLDFSPNVSHDGKKLSFISDRDGNREIYLVDLVWMDGYTQWEASNLINLSQSPGHEWTPKFSPDGEKIVYSYYDVATDNYDIYLYYIEEKNKINLTNRLGYEINPQFSPDGSYIIYQSWQKGVREIFFMNILEKNEVNLSRNPSTHDIITDRNSFSPDGQKIVFTSEREGNQDIFLMNADGSNKKNITKDSANDWAPIFSLNSNKIIFQSDRDGNWEIYMIDLNNSKNTNLTNNPTTDFSFTILPIYN